MAALVYTLVNEKPVRVLAPPKIRSSAILYGSFTEERPTEERPTEERPHEFHFVPFRPLSMSSCVYQRNDAIQLCIQYCCTL